MFDEGSPAATTWTDTLRTTLLERGWDGIRRMLARPPRHLPANAPQRARLDELRNDLGHHVSHLNYAERLREGRSIGSGQIEGACQNLIGRRLKQTAARWRVRRDPLSLSLSLARVCRMASLCSIMYSCPQNTYWSQHVA